MRTAVFTLVATVVAISAISGRAQEANNELEDLHSRLDSARAEISAIQQQAGSVEEQITSIDEQIAAVERALAISSELVERTQADITVLHSRIADTRRRYEHVSAQAHDIALDFYKAGPNAELEMLLSAESLLELDSMTRFSSAARQDRIRAMVSSQRLKVQLDSDKSELERKLGEAQVARDEQLAQRQHLGELRSAQRAKLADLRKRIAATRSEAQALAARSKEIEQQLASLAAATLPATEAPATVSPTGAGLGGSRGPPVARSRPATASVGVGRTKGSTSTA